MANNLESQIKVLFSIQRRVQAQLGFYRIQEAYNLQSITNDAINYVRRLQCFILGSHSLLLILSEEEALLIELHLVKGLKWESTIYEYEKKYPFEMGTNKRTYMNRQQSAIRKIADYVTSYSDRFDFSWLQDPLINDLAVA